MKAWIGLPVLVLAGCTGLSSGGSSAPSGPDWCLYVGKAAGQWDNIGQGAQQQTATVTDEAHYFDQLAGDLDMVATLGGGRWGAAAARGETGAKQARVQLLTGGNPGPGAAKVREALSTLSQKCP